MLFLGVILRFSVKLRSTARGQRYFHLKIYSRTYIYVPWAFQPVFRGRNNTSSGVKRLKFLTWRIYYLLTLNAEGRFKTSTKNLRYRRWDVIIRPGTYFQMEISLASGSTAQFYRETQNYVQKQHVYTGKILVNQRPSSMNHQSFRKVRK